MYKREWESLVQIIEKTEISFFDKSLYSIKLYNLLIIGEDHRFIQHSGVDFIALCRAIWRTLFCGRREGGSTIAMQLVRVLSGRYDITISRKILESYLAIRMTKYMPRDRIVALYLSVAYFGWNMNGIEQAFEQLGLDSESLSLRDAAGLIARLKYPESKNFSAKRESMIEMRTNYILLRYEELTFRGRNGSI